jgi:EAL domain-containing protein (putative c-di-GMP-specific phosphodiesterase class I)
MIILVLAAAWTDMGFYVLAPMPEYQVLANWMRCVYHAMLFLILVHYIAYISEITQYKKQRLYVILANIIFAVMLLADILTTLSGPTFFVKGTEVHFQRHGTFFYGYLAFAVLCGVLIAKVRNLLYRRVMTVFYGTMGISFLLFLVQGLAGQNSFTVAALMFPVLTMMYTIHTNPYDVVLGSNDLRVMRDLVRHYSKRNRPFMFMSLYMRDFDEEGRRLPDELKPTIRNFADRYFRNARMFRISEGHVIVLFPKNNNEDYNERINRILEAFQPLYQKYRYDYKIVIGDSVDVISKNSDYVNYIKSIHRSMAECSVHWADAEDESTFHRSEYILRELSDIYHKEDLDDPRVLLYCQPVLNVKTGRYDTAEALMRLKLEEASIVTPDQFIPLAEEQGYIHMLTRIILHKACEAIRRYTDAGYEIDRISINVSVQELRDKDFCSDIMSIIRQSGIPGSRIAIELTESRSESDFMLMKEKIQELKRNGVIFYLDDFGTGYSNMERIMELPFDIIKFDRSMVLASGADARSKRMVSYLAYMFSEMNYYVLYEGVEKETDELMCKGMSATYLQGFRYSRPTPIEELRGYICRRNIS